MRRFTIPIRDTVNGKTHVSTTWQVSMDIDFSVMLEEEVDSVIYKNLFLSTTNLINDDKAYVRARMKYDDDTYDEWSEIYRFSGTSDEEFRENIILNFVDMPTFTVDNRFYNVNENIFTIDTSSIRTIDAYHRATSYIIENDNGEIIYSNLENTINLTSIDIDKNNLDLKGVNIITINVFHHNNSKGISKVASELFYMGKYDFDISSNLINVPLVSDVVITIDWVIDAEYESLDNVEIISMRTGKNILSIDSVTNSIVIPKESLSENEYYILRLYPKNRKQPKVFYKDYFLNTI